MTHLLNYLKLKNKKLSAALRIAADAIEENELNNYPKTVNQLNEIFRKLVKLEKNS